MRFTKEFPLFLGWLLSFLIAIALTAILLLPLRGKSFTVESEFIGFIVLFFAFYLLVAFLMFVVSIKNVVIPLYQKNKIVSGEFGQMKMSAYVSHWFLGWVYSVLFCLPLLCWASLFPLHRGVVYYTWQSVASYFAYRFVVKKWMEERISHTHSAKENPIPTA